MTRERKIGWLADNFERRIVALLEEPPGWEIELECGHKSWWAIQPVAQRVYCSQCLDNAIAAAHQELGGQS